MIKHLRYFLSPILLLVAIFTVLKGNYYPIFFVIFFDLFTMGGDLLLKEDNSDFKNPSPFILNLALYLQKLVLFLFLDIVEYFLCSQVIPMDWIL